MLTKRKKPVCLTAEWTADYLFRSVGKRHVLECGVVKRKTVAAGVFWEVRIIHILSSSASDDTGQMRYSLALSARDAVRQIQEAARILGFKGKVRIYAMDGMLLLS